MRDGRAIVFDLDDTLYPHRAFAASGFRAVARFVCREHGVTASAAFRLLARERRTSRRGQELQALCKAFGLPLTLVPWLVTLIREHTPSIELPTSSRRMLEALRPAWRIGVLTNGIAAVQKRKVDALGLAPLVDEVVCAAECGDGSGKPSPDGFRAVLDRLGAPAVAAVFVGDDAAADMAGARRVGMKAVHVFPPGAASRPCDAVCCDAHVTTLDEVPLVASRIVFSRSLHHAV